MLVMTKTNSTEMCKVTSEGVISQLPVSAAKAQLCEVFAENLWGFY